MRQFEELYRDYWQDVSRFLFRLTGYQQDLAEELTQETFYQAMMSFHRYRGECQIKTWLCQIAKNTYFNMIRKDRKRKQIQDSESMNHSFTEPIIAEYETGELIRHAVQVIAGLDDTMRDVLIYRIFSDLTYAQISALLGVNENTAKVLYMRGKTKLQNKLREEYGHEL